MAPASFAVLVTIGLQLLRVLFPLAFDLSEDAGSIDAGLFTLAVFALSPFLASLLSPLARTRSRWLLIGGTVTARVAVQVVHPIPLWLATVGAVLFLAALTLEVHEVRGRLDGQSVIVLGLLGGLALDVAIRTAFWTWDPAWQDGLVPLAVAVALGTALVVLLALNRLPETSREEAVPVGGLVALGPFLMLQVLFLQSPAFVASASGAPLPAASAVILAADALAVATLSRLGQRTLDRGAILVAGVLLVGDAVLLRALDGVAVALVVLVGTPLAVGLLFAGLAHTRPGRPSALRTAGAMAGAYVAFLLLAFAYQVHYDIPLPVSNGWLPPLAALLLAVPAVLRAPARAERRPRISWRLALAPLLLLLVPLVTTLTRTTDAGSGGPGVRIVDYNVHMAVNLDGQVDPETLARTIEEQDPDVVVLQEIARGWVTNGTTDLAEWMSVRLGMRYVFGPAADGQFGNLVLSRLPIASSQTGHLGRFEGNMDRGWVRVEVDVGPAGHEGEARLTVIGTHLQHRDQDTPTRLRQIDVLLRDAWRGDGAAVIAGDMNDFPDSEEFAAFTSAGFLSAQDEAGQGDLPTSWRDGTRIDYIFVTPDLGMSDFLRPYTEASDHLPLVVTILPP